MDEIVADCSTGEVTVAPMSDEDAVALQQAQTEAVAQEQAAAAARQQEVSQAGQVQAAQVTAAQALIDTAVNEAQADALRAFIRTMGVQV